MLAHVIQQLRDRRDRAVALAALTAVLESAGTIVGASTGYDGDSENVRVSSGGTRVGRFLSSPRRSGRDVGKEEPAAVIFIDFQHEGRPVVLCSFEAGPVPEGLLLASGRNRAPDAVALPGLPL